MEIQLLESAKNDLREGFVFYEEQSPGLGDYFLHSINADVRKLPPLAGIHVKVNGFHRYLAKHFPFAIYYLVSDQTIDVYAILDCRRDPAWVQAKLRQIKPDTHA